VPNPLSALTQLDDHAVPQVPEGGVRLRQDRLHRGKLTGLHYVASFDTCSRAVQQHASCCCAYCWLFKRLEAQYIASVKPIVTSQQFSRALDVSGGKPGSVGGVAHAAAAVVCRASVTSARLAVAPATVTGTYASAQTSKATVRS
jgi:hypothetical protein